MHESTRYPKPFGKYLLLRQLAVGGMAEVYLARQSGPAGFEKECVIKRILPTLAVDQQFVNMFLDEARIAARLSHPNIVQIFDLGSIGEGDYFLAMEHVHGVDLQQVIDAEAARDGRIPLALAIRLCSHVAEGLEHAHHATDGRGVALGLVHRDITPSNVIVSFDGVAKILDFGIAKAVAKKGRTEVGVIKGKIPYMSPEQVQGETLDGRSDIFSLGVVLYELTTGQKPFDGTNPAELSIKILHDQPQPPSLLIDGYPPVLEQIVLRALDKRREARFASARELHEALDEFLLHMGVRCTSHDVAAYLDTLFPGRREQVRDEAAGLPIEVTDPTVPMQVGGSAPRMLRGGSAPRAISDDRREEQPPGSLVIGDLSAPVGYDEVRRGFGGGSGRGGSTAVIALLVIGVAAGFWYLVTHVGKNAQATASSDAPAATTSTAEKPAVAPPDKPPSELPAPSLSGDAKVTATHADGDKPAAPTEAKADAPKPDAPKAKPVVAAKPKPPAVKHTHEDAPRSLPRLPTPPPPDDEN